MSKDQQSRNQLDRSLSSGTNLQSRKSTRNIKPPEYFVNYNDPTGGDVYKNACAAPVGKNDKNDLANMPKLSSAKDNNDYFELASSGDEDYLSEGISSSGSQSESTGEDSQSESDSNNSTNLNGDASKLLDEQSSTSRSNRVSSTSRKRVAKAESEENQSSSESESAVSVKPVLRKRKFIDYVALAAETNNGEISNLDALNGLSDDEGSDGDSEDSDVNYSPDKVKKVSETDVSSTDQSTEESEAESSAPSEHRQHALGDDWENIELAFQLAVLGQRRPRSLVENLLQSVRVHNCLHRRRVSLTPAYLKYFKKRQKNLRAIDQATKLSSKILACINLARTAISHHVESKNMLSVQRNLQMLCELSAIPSIENGISHGDLVKMQNTWTRYDEAQAKGVHTLRCDKCKKPYAAAQAVGQPKEAKNCVKPYYPLTSGCRLCAVCQSDPLRAVTNAQ